VTPADAAPAAAVPPSSDAASETASATSAAPAPPAAPAAPATTAGQGAFSADAISNILSGIPAPQAGPNAAPGGFSADAISSILSGIAPAGAPLTLSEVLQPGETAPLVDAAMETALSEHLPASDSVPETAAETLSTPQMAQATTDASQAEAASSAEPMETDNAPGQAPAPDKMEE